jgi:hypothetical protein
MKTSEEEKSLERRTLLAGAGTAGALAAAATVLPPVQQIAQPVHAGAEPTPDTSAGYRLTEHVKRYYASTRI